jgi:hypothetical protein
MPSWVKPVARFRYDRRRPRGGGVQCEWLRQCTNVNHHPTTLEAIDCLRYRGGRATATSAVEQHIDAYRRKLPGTAEPER